MLSEEQKKLVEDNVRLVSLILTKNGIRWNEDVFQSGCHGLCKAAMTFDPSKGFAFSTYASRCIWTSIAMYYRYHNRDMEKASVTLSLDYEMGGPDGSTMSLSDIIPDGDILVDERVYRDDVKSKFVEFLETIPERDKKIMLSYLAGETQGTISRVWGYSQSYICRIIKNTQQKFKKYYGYGGGVSGRSR